MKQRGLSSIAIILGLAPMLFECWFIWQMIEFYRKVELMGDISPSLVTRGNTLLPLVIFHLASLILALIAVFKKQQYRWIALAIGILSVLSFFAPLW